MHPIHTTPGFIIDSRPYGEAGKILFIFTRDLGLVSVAAQGIRLEKSKLRYFAQDHRFGTFSLVRGKDYWRLTSAQSSISESDQAARSAKASELISRIALLLRRVLQGEEPHPELFECVGSWVDFVAANKDLTEEELKTLESVGVFRIMKSLGYVGEDDSLPDGIDDPVLTSEFLRGAMGKRTLLNKHINKALKESHL